MDLNSPLNRNEQFRKVWNAVHQSWMPANPAFLERLTAELDRGVYDKDINSLVDEIRTDISLFSYCVKALKDVVSDTPFEHDPDSFLRRTSIEQLKQVISEMKDGVQHSRFNEMDSAQAARLQEAMISASVAEKISDEVGLGAGLGFSTGIMRQLGLALISWNYPHVYARAAAKAQSADELEDLISRTLGFRPSLIGIVLAKKWCLPRIQRAALGDTSSLRELPPEEAEQIERMASELETICSIGEALARASNPEAYPTARDDWNHARREIERRLGRLGMDRIKKSLVANCRQYIRHAPHSFSKDIIEKIDRRPEVLSGADLFSQNKYIRACTPDVQRMLKKLYENLDSQTISKENVRLLTSTIMPAAGFSSGCVFVYDPEKRSLVPRAPVGGVTLDHYSEIDCSPIAKERPLVVKAFESNEVIVSEDAWSSDDSTAYGAAYGRIQRAGVLLLNTRSVSHNALLVFSALNQALIDCLKLK
ncbi:MAG: HDOD domain-containing protein [Bdellovibrionales bacterium]|nr:HDOD domain-containing protein [Bdellovibrionales bacterium]